MGTISSGPAPDGSPEPTTSPKDSMNEPTAMLAASAERERLPRPSATTQSSGARSADPRFRAARIVG